MIKKNNINNRKSQNRSRSEILAPPRREFQQSFRKSLIQFRLELVSREFVSNFQIVLTQCEQWIFPDYREACRLHQKYLDLKNLMADRIELLLIFKWTKLLVLKGNNWHIPLSYSFAYTQISRDRNNVHDLNLGPLFIRLKTFFGPFSLTIPSLCAIR